MKEKVIEKLKATGIPELQNVAEFCELPGAYVNPESELPDGTVGKILDDERTYLCCQVPIDGETSYGVAACESEIVIYRYKNDDSESKVVRVIPM